MFSRRHAVLTYIILLSISTFAGFLSYKRTTGSSSFSISSFQERFAFHWSTNRNETHQDYSLVKNEELRTSQSSFPEEVDYLENGKLDENIFDALAFCKLPRTSARPYNLMEPGKKYFTYSPSGGFSNQLIELLTGIAIARMYGRALLVPPCAGHTNFFQNFEKQSGDFMVPMDTVLDFEYMEKSSGVELVPLTVQPSLLERRESSKMEAFGVRRIWLHGKMKANENQLVSSSRGDFIGDSERITLPFKEEMQQSSEYRLVFAYAKFFAKRFEFKDNYLYRHVRYSPYLRQFAQTIVSEIFDRDTAFAAVHVRLGDTKYRYNGTSELHSRYLQQVLKLPRHIPLYILSDARKENPFLKSIQTAFSNITFASDLSSYPRVQEVFSDFLARLRGNRIVKDLFGTVEQLIAVQADWFLGTYKSTFSRSISVFRENLYVALPELAVGNNTQGTRQIRPERVTSLINYQGTEMAYIRHHGFNFNSTEILRCSLCGMLF